MKATLIHGVVHVEMGTRGRRVWVPAPQLGAHARTGSLRLRAMGPRPPLRALRASQPQVQACSMVKRVHHVAPSGVEAAPSTWLAGWDECPRMGVS